LRIITQFSLAYLLILRSVSSLLAFYYGRLVEQSRPLYFCPVVSLFVLLSSFSSPNLSGRRLDVYHRPTSTHAVTLVRILNAGLKCAACGWLVMQNAKKSPKIRRLGTIAQLCRAISSQLRHALTIGKKLDKQQYYLPHTQRVRSRGRAPQMDRRPLHLRSPRRHVQVYIVSSSL